MKKIMLLTLLLAFAPSALAAVTPLSVPLIPGEEALPTPCNLRLSPQGTTLVCNSDAGKNPENIVFTAPTPYSEIIPVQTFNYANPQTFSVSSGGSLSLVITGAKLQGILSKPADWKVSWSSSGPLEVLLFEVAEKAPTGAFACVQTRTTAGNLAPICVFAGSTSGYVQYR